MPTERLHRVSGHAILALSLTAFATVLTGYVQAPQPDEGTSAHIFQLTILLVVPAVVLFLASINWKRPSRDLRPLAMPSVALVAAFTALYYLEHVWYR